MNNIEIWYKLYQDGKSLEEIAEKFNTYPNKIYRAFKKAGKTLRDKSAAQKNALEKKGTHPMSGKRRSDATKKKIGKATHKWWKNLDSDSYKEMCESAKTRWENIPLAQRELMQKRAGEAIREAAKTGSKLERALYKKLLEAKFNPQLHPTNIANGLEVDLFLPNLKVAIEVDGPAHFLPIWGQESLERHIQNDARKSGLLLAHGYVIIRIKHLSDQVSSVYVDKIFNELHMTLLQIKKKFPEKSDRFIEIGDINE